MLGGEFITHGAIVQAEVRVDEPSHPIVAHLCPRFSIVDEWYRIRREGTEMTQLLSVPGVPADGVGTPGDRADLPLSWI